MGGSPEADLTLAYSPIDVTGLEFTGGRMALSDMAFTLNYGFSGSLIRRKQQHLGIFGYARPSGPRSRTACSRSYTIDQSSFSVVPTGRISLFVDPMFVDLSTDPTTGTETSVTYLYSDPGAAADEKGYRIRFE